MNYPYSFNTELLKQWFSCEKRDLPWRQDRSPYSVWISEIMLQQTQVSVVISYFKKWMALFPTIDILAKASVDEVIKAWEGLGYYSRARNIHSAAIYISKNYGGQFPQNYKEWEQIKGIGPYTSAAIRSFAFHEKAAPVDGNVYRVLSRYFKIEEPIDKTQTQKQLQKIAFEITPDIEPWVHAEALIEFGATICQKKPKCDICPLKQNCQAYVHGCAPLLPRKSKKITYEKLERNVAVLVCKDKLYVTKCKKNSVMSDLYEFLYFAKNQDNEEQKGTGKRRMNQDREIQEMTIALKKQGFNARYTKALSLVTHSFTKYRVTLFPYVFEVLGAEFANELLSESNCYWIAMHDIQKLAFSSGHKRILQSYLKEEELCCV